MDYNKIQPIIEVYRAIQSEGSLNGIPHIIVRTTGCTHRCFFSEGGWCDSWYTSIHPEKGKYTLEEVKQFFVNNKDINHLMITGGSPTMHPELVNELITMFKTAHVQIEKSNWTWEELWANSEGIITMETEGSHFIETDLPIDLVSISPKFSNTIPKLGTKTPIGKDVDQKLIDQHNKMRLNTHAISQMVNYHFNYQYKPVWDGTEENLQEIEDFRLALGIPKSKTWIMPAGDSKSKLLEMYPITIRMCTDNGYNFSGRDHILAFGNEREI